MLDGLARELAGIFHRHQEEVARTLTRTSLSSREEHLDGLLHWLYTAVIRMARERLQEDGLLPLWPEHADGSRWLWWAEEPLEGEEPRLQAHSPRK